MKLKVTALLEERGSGAEKDLWLRVTCTNMSKFTIMLDDVKYITPRCTEWTTLPWSIPAGKLKNGMAPRLGPREQAAAFSPGISKTTRPCETIKIRISTLCGKKIQRRVKTNKLSKA